MDKNTIMDNDASGYFAANDRERLRAQYENGERLRTALETINRLLSPGNRTPDEMMRDMGYACDVARTALTKSRA